MSDEEPRSHKTEVTLYRCGCRHCDEAERSLAALAKRHGARLTVRNVERDPELKDLELGGWRTPLVSVDGRHVSHYEFNPKKWEAALREGARAAPTRVIGEVVDLHCYLESGAKGPEHRRCAEACIAEGMPMGLAAGGDELYLLVRDLAARQAFDRLAALVSEPVVVTGDVFERGGVRAIVVRSVEAVS